MRKNQSQSHIEMVGILQAMSAAVSQQAPFEEVCLAIMDIVGRFLGLTVGRISTVDGTDTIGEVDFVWTNPDDYDPQIHLLDFGDQVTQSPSKQEEPVIISAILTDEFSVQQFPHPMGWVRGYVAYPIRVGHHFPAELEFFSANPLGPEITLNAIVAHTTTLLSFVFERERSQLLFRERDRRFGGIFDHSQQFIGLLRPDGTLLEVNETALRYGGLSAEQVVGQAFWNTYWWQASLKAVADLRSAISRAANGENVRFEATIQGVDGQTSITDFSITPIRNRVHEIVMLIAEGRDITEFRRALDHLHHVESRLEEAQLIAHVGHWEYIITDEQTYFSDLLVEIFGLNPEINPITTENFVSRVHPDDVDGLQRTLNRSFHNRQPFAHHFRVVRPDGTTRMVYSAGGVVVDAEGQVSRMSGIVQDVSSRRQLEDTLARMVDRLTGLNALGKSVVTSMDMSEIYQRVLSAGRSLLNADAVIMFSHEGDELVVSAVDQADGLVLLGLRIPDSAGIAGEVWINRQPVWYYGEECRSHLSARLAKSSGFNPGSIIAVPVSWQDQILGVLEAADRRDDAFDAEDVSVLGAVANWTAIAIGNAGQHHTLKRQLKESEAIAVVSRALSETLEPQAILELIVDTAHDLVPRSDWAVIHLLRGRPEKLDPAAVAGTEADLSGYIIGPDEGIAGLALSDGHVINVGETRLDPRASAFAQRMGLRSLLVAPIVSRNRRLGTISLHCMEPNAFTFEDERLLTILAAQAGLAIENAHLFDSQRRARLVAELQRERMRVLADQVVTAQEEERLRISRELHDEAGQALTSLKISLDLIRSGLPPGLDTLQHRLSDLSTLTGETMESLRTLAHDLRPPGLDTFGLNIALEGLCHDFETRTGIHVDYDGVEVPNLPTAAGLSLFRMAQAALTNVAKHAEASKATVRLFERDKSVVLTIIDDGKGFDYDPDSRHLGGIGLVSMQERADLVGGTLEIDSSIGKGTVLTVHIPIELLSTITTETKPSGASK